MVEEVKQYLKLKILDSVLEIDFLYIRKNEPNT
jgi:hypothetical protein